LPNVLAGRFVVPEFLQSEATVANLSRAALNLYDDALVRRRLEALFAGMTRSLDADTGTRVADAVQSELRAAGVSC
jgi:lipid-A-disaccharide synthase